MAGSKMRTGTLVGLILTIWIFGVPDAQAQTENARSFQAERSSNLRQILADKDFRPSGKCHNAQKCSQLLEELRQGKVIFVPPTEVQRSLQIRESLRSRCPKFDFEHVVANGLPATAAQGSTIYEYSQGGPRAVLIYQAEDYVSTAGVHYDGLFFVFQITPCKIISEITIEKGLGSTGNLGYLYGVIKISGKLAILKIYPVKGNNPDDKTVYIMTVTSFHDTPTKKAEFYKFTYAPR